MPTDPEQVDDLLCSAKAGDESALAALFDLFRQRMESMVKLRLHRKLIRRIDPADVVQEAYISIQKKFGDYCEQDKLPFHLWVRLEVGQKLVDIHRFHLGVKMRDATQEVSLHRGGIPSVTSITLAEQLMGKFSSASQAAIKAEIKLKVQDALNSMEPHDREMLVMRHFEELTNSDAALLLGISPSAACNRYVRALKRLRKVFEELPGGLESVWS